MQADQIKSARLPFVSGSKKNNKAVMVRQIKPNVPKINCGAKCFAAIGNTAITRILAVQLQLTHRAIAAGVKYQAGGKISVGSIHGTGPSPSANTTTKDIKAPACKLLSGTAKAIAKSSKKKAEPAVLVSTMRRRPTRSNNQIATRVMKKFTRAKIIGTREGGAFFSSITPDEADDKTDDEYEKIALTPDNCCPI